MRNAGIFARLIAFLIDGFVLSLFAALLAFIISIISDIDLRLSNEYFNVVSTTATVVLVLSVTFLEFLYFGFLWSTLGKTIGMSIFDIMVVRSTGDRIGFFRAGLRGTVGYWISGLIFGLGYIWALFDSDRQAWHDKIFDTVVVKG